MGDDFTINSEKEFSDKWMKPLDSKVAAKLKREGKLDTDKPPVKVEGEKKEEDKKKEGEKGKEVTGSADVI